MKTKKSTQDKLDDLDKLQNKLKANLTQENKIKEEEEKKKESLIELAAEKKKALIELAPPNIPLPAAPPPKPKGSFDFIKFGAFISITLFMVAGVIVVFKGLYLDQEEAMLPFIYTLIMGWMMFILMLIPLIIARKEIWTKFKVFGRKSKVIILRMIGGDANEIDIVLTLKGNTMEVGENKVIINPRKATMKDGIRVLTYVADNALAHDYFEDPNKTLRQIAADLNKNTEDNMHDIFTDPIRVDAKYFNETFLAAQQTNPDILKKIISFLTSKNILVMLGAIALAAGAAALLGLQANNILNSIPFCNPTQIVP